jgi:hypothetical protein
VVREADNGGVVDIAAADAERIQQRYPRSRLPRAVWVALVGAGVAVAGSWLIWAATVGAYPDVNAVVSAYTVRSDTEIEATLTVDRADPGRTAACRVMAQATDFRPVAEQTVTIRPDPNTVVDVTVTMKTLRRATTAVVKDCSLI